MVSFVDAVVEDMPDFLPSEEDLAFIGDPDDRRAVMAHRRKSTQLQVGLSSPSWTLDGPEALPACNDGGQARGFTKGQGRGASTHELKKAMQSFSMIVTRSDMALHS